MPDPGLADLIAAEIARHRLRYGSEDAYNGERWLCTTCPWLVEADTGSRPNTTVIQAHANHVAERLKLVVEPHANGRTTEPETTSEGGKRWYVNECASVEFDAACDIWLNEVDPYVGDSGHARKLAAALIAAATASDDLRADLEGEQQ